jgi:hypothetical protein
MKKGQTKKHLAVQKVNPTGVYIQNKSVHPQSLDVETLKLLFQQLLRLPDEQTVRIVLGLPNE